MAATTWIIKENFRASVGQLGVGVSHILITPDGISYGTPGAPRQWFAIGYKSNTSGSLTPAANNITSCISSSSSPTVRKDIPVSAGWKVTFIGDVYLDYKLSSWLESNATLVEPIKVEGSIDFDDEWIQKDCHWEYDRLFTFTCKIYSGDLTDIRTGATLPGSSYVSRDFKISFMKNPTDTGFTIVHPKVKTYQVPFNGNYTRKLEVLTYAARASTWVNYTRRDSTGDLTVTLKVGTLNIEGIRQDNSIQEVIPFQTPPKQIASVTPSLVVSNPGELRISWTKPDVYNDESDSVHGYCIEVASCAENSGTSAFSPIKGLKWDETTLSSGKYSLVKDTEYTELTFDSTSYKPEDITNGEFTFGSDATSREFYINDPDTTEFYFRPKDIGINPGDYFQITVYPYVVYSSYFCYDDCDTCPYYNTENCHKTHASAFLASTATLGSNKISKGVVRVKAPSGNWVEGQVWVMTADGWRQAEAVYAKTNEGWKEAQ